MANGEPGHCQAPECAARRWHQPKRRSRVAALLVVPIAILAACSGGKGAASTTTVALTDSVVDTTTTAVATTTETTAATTTTTVPTTTTSIVRVLSAGSHYTVQVGDTLKAIAASFGVTVQAVVDTNKITDPNKILVGQVLTIPKKGTTVTTTKSTSTTAKSSSTTAGTGTTYTVVAGDTLAKIAGKFGVTMSALQTANNITDPNTIYVGQVLKIPAK